MKKVLFVFAVCLAPVFVYSQKSVELTLGVGYTAIDVEALVEIDENENTIATDWGTTNVGISAQGFFLSFGNIGIGGELMYQSLYWYSVRIPYGIQPIYREYSIDAVRITPIVRFGVNNSFAFDLGPEFNILNGLKIGLMASANYYIRITDKIDIPVKLRLDVINNIVVTAPISVNAGIRLKL